MAALVFPSASTPSPRLLTIIRSTSLAENLGSTAIDVAHAQLPDTAKSAAQKFLAVSTRRDSKSIVVLRGNGAVESLLPVMRDVSDPWTMVQRRQAVARS